MTKGLSYIFLLLSFSAFAQTDTAQADFRLKVNASFTVDQGTYDGFTVVLTQDSIPIDTVYGRSQNTFLLDYNHKYVLTLSKEGYISKSVTILTSGLTKEIWNEGTDDILFSMTIFQPSKNKNKKDQIPVYVYYYDTNLDGFNYNVTYKTVDK